MTNVSTTCVLPDLNQFVQNLIENETDLAGLGPGIAVGVAADVVAASLSFVGLEAFILATALEGETLTELLLELQMSTDLQNQVTTRIRTETQRCIQPAIGATFGIGSRGVETMQRLWNRNGSQAMDSMAARTGSGAFVASTPAQAAAIRNWRRVMANLFNCVEMLIESGIMCQPEQRGQRCRVPAMVERCLIRIGSEDLPGADQ